MCVIITAALPEAEAGRLMLHCLQAQHKTTVEHGATALLTAGTEGACVISPAALPGAEAASIMQRSLPGLQGALQGRRATVHLAAWKEGVSPMADPAVPAATAAGGMMHCDLHIRHSEAGEHVAAAHLTAGTEGFVCVIAPAALPEAEAGRSMHHHRQAQHERIPERGATGHLTAGTEAIACVIAPEAQSGSKARGLLQTAGTSRPTDHALLLDAGAGIAVQRILQALQGMPQDHAAPARLQAWTGDLRVVIHAASPLSPAGTEGMRLAVSQAALTGAEEGVCMQDHLLVPTGNTAGSAA